MRKELLTFLLGAAVMLCFAYKINEERVYVIPERPVSVIVQDFRTTFGLEKEMKQFIESKIREGYQVKSVAIMDDENWSKGIVVMERW